MQEIADEDIFVPIVNELDRKIAETFTTFDYNDNRTIDVRDIGTVIRGLGCCPSEAEVQEIIVKLEKPRKPGVVHLADFLPCMTQLITNHRFMPSTPEQLLEAFQVLDSQGKGFLTKERISRLMTEDGEPFTQDELVEMLEIALDPHTQTVPYEYYINQLMFEPKVYEEDVYEMSEAIIARTPVKKASKRFSQIILDMQQAAELGDT